LDEDSGRLYDWRADPAEQYDLSSDMTNISIRMRAEVLEFYGVLKERADTMSAPEPVDMSPKRIEMLRSLGYIR
jgi:hypothetical protein